MILDRRTSAVLWAQWRTLRNFYPRANRGGLVFTAIMGLLWYGSWLTGALVIAKVISISRQASLERFLPFGFFFGCLYWQLVPLLMASAGATLDMRRLLVYPIPHRSLFGVEVLLRLTTGIEVLLILGGAAAGLWLHPSVPVWAPLFVLPFALFNMLLSAGVRELLTRVFAQKRLREIAIFLLVMVAAVPQLIAVRGVPAPVRAFFVGLVQGWYPWSVTGYLASGTFGVPYLAALAAWVAFAYVFGRWQFERGLRFDVEAAKAADRPKSKGTPWSETLFRIPTLLFRDPLGALVEKEVRFLARSPRFRLVFLMGFSFSLLIWFPMAFRPGGGSSFMGANFLTIATVYSLMLLGEVSFWNTFGFDRSAAQMYWLAPVPFRTVLIGKNLTACLFILLEILLVAAVCGALRLPVSPPKVAEALAVAVVLSVYLLAIGNLSSTHYPRAVNPAQSWRSTGAGKWQALLLIIYPVISIPIALAYLARWAVDAEWAFYAALGVAAAIGLAMYHVALESAVEAAAAQREQIIETLSKSEGPIAMG
ncbi:MAG TPA: hypothetical protein DEH78_22740 [Solibacterales bacterium]|nr:hypothetical protein [Bryobacterales bacterium]